MEFTRNESGCHDALSARMRMGFWQRLVSPLGYIGAAVLAFLGLGPADFATWLSNKISPDALSWIASDKARWVFVIGALGLFLRSFYYSRGQTIIPDITINEVI